MHCRYKYFDNKNVNLILGGAEIINLLAQGDKNQQAVALCNLE